MKIYSKRCALEIDANGRVATFENVITGEKYPLCDNGEYIVVDGEKYTSGRLEVKEQNAEKCVLSDGTFTVSYIAHESYIEKKVSFASPKDGIIEAAGVFDVGFPDAKEVHFHDDCTIFHCPMCNYARHEKGGVFYGLAYPYWDGIEKLVFSPYIKVSAGEEFLCEKVFLGAFETTGKMISSHGPYPGKKKQRYHDMFKPERAGLGQHFAGMKVPEDVGVPEEEQDAGEIAAMRKFFREHLGRMPLPEGGYFVWQNGWWAGLDTPDTSVVDVLTNAGVHDMMTAAMYLGYANHPNCEPNYIRDTRIKPLGFPVSSSEEKITTLSDGYHEEIKIEEKSKDDMEYQDHFSASDGYHKFIKYGKDKGFNIASFSTPNNYYHNAPEWASLDENGKAYEYFATKLSCPACKEYMDHHFNVLCSIFDQYGPRYWGFDGRWLGYNELEGYTGKHGEEPCYAENHGHLPGKSRYIEWKNIEDFKRRMREKYPEMCLEQYYGLKRGSTWALMYFNGDENYYECPCADDNRYQTWHNENDRFRPTYMNYSPIFCGTSKEEFEYGIISAISDSAYSQLADGYNALRDSEECVKIFKKWRAWGEENSKYMGDREFLFGCPGDVTVDGSAHIIDGEGWVFLFCTVDEAQKMDLDLSDIPGLCSGKYDVEIIHPETRKFEGVSSDGVVSFDMAPHSAAVIKFTVSKA